MFATIRGCARLFKSVGQKVQSKQQKTVKSIHKIWWKGRRLIHWLRAKLKSMLGFRKSKQQAPSPILLNLPMQTQDPVKTNLKSRQKIKKKGKKRRKKLHSGKPCQDKHPNQVDKQQGPKLRRSQEHLIAEFYQEWEANWGPKLTSLDKQFLETADDKTVVKVIAHARLTLKSPYLKAVYNGLKDLEEIADLLEHDHFAQEKVRPVLADYYQQGPEKFSEMLVFFHDKGYFPTRSGERRLSLDPRLIPGWLGLVS